MSRLSALAALGVREAGIYPMRRRCLRRKMPAAATLTAERHDAGFGAGAATADSGLLEFAERHHRDGGIVSRRVEGDIHRCNCADAAHAAHAADCTCAGSSEARYSATAWPRWLGTAAAISSRASASLAAAA
jgi:hypothetical protein